MLVEKICNKLKKGLVVGDEVNFTVDDKVMKGEVVEVIQRQTPVVRYPYTFFKAIGIWRIVCDPKPVFL